MDQHLHGSARARIPPPSLLLAAAVAAASGCAPVEPAPEDLDGLFHYAWRKAVDGSDEELAQAVVHADTAVQDAWAERSDQPLAVGDRFDGALSDLSREEVDLVGLPAEIDPSAAAGMFLVDVLPCTLDQVERITYALDQDVLYEGAYDDYRRVYTSDLDAYLSGETDLLTFESEIAATLLGASYTETVLGSLRRVPTLDAERSPFGTVLVARYHIPEPAVFDDEAYFFEQDYQIEVFWERAPSEVVHLYGLWRRMGFATASTDDESIVRLILNGLADWDDRTAELCREGAV